MPYRTILALLYFISPFVSLAGAFLVAVGVVSLVMGLDLPPWAVASRLACMLFGAAIATLGWKTFRAGNKYLDVYDFQYMAAYGAAWFVVVIVYQVVKYPSMSDLSIALVASPFALWAGYLRFRARRMTKREAV